jgi:hypothetical protein
VDLTIEERLARVEERLGAMEASLARLQRPCVGMTVEEARAKLDKPAEGGPEQFARLHRIFGRFEGPGDLSERMRDYLYGERD